METDRSFLRIGLGFGKAVTLQAMTSPGSELALELADLLLEQLEILASAEAASFIDAPPPPLLM